MSQKQHLLHQFSQVTPKCSKNVSDYSHFKDTIIALKLSKLRPLHRGSCFIKQVSRMCVNLQLQTAALKLPLCSRMILDGQVLHINESVCPCLLYSLALPHTSTDIHTYTYTHTIAPPKRLSHATHKVKLISLISDRVIICPRLRFSTVHVVLCALVSKLHQGQEFSSPRCIYV